MKHGKAIELFLVNGTADSLVTAELSNWNGKAIKIPRIEVSDCTRKDLSSSGVYFLFCKDENDANSDSVYIGESENIRQRLIQHIRDYNNEKENFYWNTAVLFIGRDLDKADIRYLENELVNTARECKRYNVLTKATTPNVTMKEAKKASMNEYIENLKILINTLGYKVLEPTRQNRSISEECLYLKIGKCEAKGLLTNEGFVLLSGAKIKEKTSAKSLREQTVKKREDLMNSDKVKEFITTEDILFTSSSAAADFIMGYSISGPEHWKNKKGISLKEIENSEI